MVSPLFPLIKFDPFSPESSYLSMNVNEQRTI